MAKITFDSSQYEKGIDAAKSKAGELASKIGSGLKAAAKIGTAALTAAATGIAALTKASVESYAEYEQLVGGVETLFGTRGAKTVEEYAELVGKNVDYVSAEFEMLQKAQSLVMQNASNSYKTAGLSINAYMETVSSFAAALKQSTASELEAAEMANMAVIDMSDNANKMGTSMEAIQTAYNGFAKQNYTMLDNLKLGYGGTKDEMQRLLDKANEINKQQGIITDYQIDSYADIVDAIHVVQTEMGITGTTAKEAASTISGSIGMMKSAWSNLVTGIADDEADFDMLITNFVDSIGTVAENILPRVEVAFNGVSSLVEKLVPIIMEKLPTLIADFLPNLAESAIGIVETILISVEDNKETLMETAFTVITTIANGMLDMLPQILLLGIDLLLSLAEGITTNLDTILPALMQTIMKIVEVLTNEENLAKFLDVALTLIAELAFGLMENIDELIDAVFSIIDGIVMFLLKPESLEKLITTAIDLVIAIGTGLIQAIPQLIISVLSLISSIDEQFENTDWAAVGDNVIQGVLDGLKRAWESVKSWFSNAWDSLFGNNDVNVDVRKRTVPDGSHRTGLDYVPFDGYIAELHKGERVLTEQEAKGYTGNTIPITNNFYGGYTERDGAKIARSINRQLGLLV
ncbi:MAG: hypothetical protein J6Q94_01180 [Clostridia bacterium]|nr:hypothetical protein [Clostridia bacterium]